jgi:phosphate transport system ATP-binding protein
LEPEVILLDRPCSGLDPISTAKIEDSLTQLKERFTIILAPHNIQQAGRVSDRVAFMLSGTLIEEGLNEDVFANPKDQRTSDYITGRFG